VKNKQENFCFQIFSASIAQELWSECSVYWHLYLGSPDQTALLSSSQTKRREKKKKTAASDPDSRVELKFICIYPIR
jgi:hypothetical protein